MLIISPSACHQGYGLSGYILLLCYTFTNFWFNTIICFRRSFTVFFIFFIFVFFAQVPYTTISCTWIIVRTMRLLISITNVVFLIFKWWGCFLWIFFLCQVYYSLLPFYMGCLFLNTFFSFYRSVQSILSFIIARNTLFIWKFTWYTCSIYRHTRKTWIFLSYIYLFRFFYFGTFIRKIG